MNLNDQAIRKGLIDALKAGMKEVRGNQGGHLSDDPEIKDDKTLVTVTDRKSERKILSRLKMYLPHTPVWAEESGGNNRWTDFSLLIDPLDGTRAFSCGLATSTIIIGIYNGEKKEVVGCLVGEAATGRIWSAFDNEPTRLNGRKVKVWEGTFDEQSTLFLDVSHGFSRKGRTIMNHEGMARLFERLKGMKLAIPGSNGLIQALVANGGQKVAGSITTAIGGPWDVCGVKLILNAGGAARAYSMQADQDRGILVERNPLDVMSYDVLITGNNLKTVEELASHLSDAL